MFLKNYHLVTICKILSSILKSCFLMDLFLHSFLVVHFFFFKQAVVVSYMLVVIWLFKMSNTSHMQSKVICIFMTVKFSSFFKINRNLK